MLKFVLRKTAFLWLALAAIGMAEEVTIYPTGPKPAAPPPTAPAPEEHRIIREEANPTAAPGTEVKPTDSPAIPAAPETGNIPAPSTETYTVVKGDSLWKISRHLKVPIDALKTANHLGSTTLQIGQVLVVPPPEIRRAIPITPKAGKAGSAPKPAAVAPVPTPPTLQEKLLGAARELAASQIGYNGSWMPPGETVPWAMDCSNTTRYLYQQAAQVTLPRTASDQFFDLQKHERAWLVPLDDKQRPDVDYLRTHLQPGDLLFWENTYKPEREPPITHVMIYLGPDAKGKMLMAGSQSSAGKFNPAHNGPDVYEFKPLQPAGGYYRFFFFGYVPGRFVAYGRPIS